MSTKTPRNAKTGRSEGSHLRSDTFPKKLHKILANPEFSDIICWLPHGRTWKVLDATAFEEKVMPQYFVMTKWSSFARQVNGWGFYRILVAGPDRDSYYNNQQLFLRDRPDLCKLMRRRTRPKFEPAPIDQVNDGDSSLSSMKQLYADTHNSIKASGNFASSLLTVSVTKPQPFSYPTLVPCGSSNHVNQRHHRVMNSSDCFTPIPVPINEEESFFFENIVSDLSDMDADDTHPSDVGTCRNGNIIFDSEKRKKFPFGQYPRKTLN